MDLNIHSGNNRVFLISFITSVMANLATQVLLEQLKLVLPLCTQVVTLLKQILTY